MTKELSESVKRNKIANFMASLPEEFEVIEDNLISKNPSIELQTKSRVIKLTCDEKGHVIEEFTMRQGAGSKDAFLLKQEAYNAIREYYNDYYTGAKIKKSSFEEGVLKLELADRVVTLTYDNESKLVEEQDRQKRNSKPKKPEVTETNQISIFDIANTTEDIPENAADERGVEKEEEPPETYSSDGDATYKKLPEGVLVKNICNNKEYKVKRDDGNIIEVFDKNHGYLIMARADLEVL